MPVYYPEVTEILGEPVYRTVADVPGDVDMVNVFRRSHDVPPHVDDIIAKQPKSVWLQLGIRNDAAAERLARAGIDVVQDRCLLVEMRRLRTMMSRERSLDDELHRAWRRASSDARAAAARRRGREATAIRSPAARSHSDGVRAG